MNWVKWYFVIVTILEVQGMVRNALLHGLSKRLIFNGISIQLLIYAPVFLVLFGIIK
jgi:hypothetical protein